MMSASLILLFSYTSTLLHFFMIHILLFAFIGLLLGSIGSVLVSRLPMGEAVLGHPRCPHCGVVLRTLQLIPLVSFIALGGRCSKCEAEISWMYPALEAGSALLFVLALWPASSVLGAFILGCGLWALLLIAMVDLRTQTIPDPLNLLLCAIGVAAVFTRGSIDLLSLLLGAGFLGLQWKLSNGRWVGSGDVFLMVGLALVLPSVVAMAFTLLFAYAFGAAAALTLLAAKRTTLESHIPFAPFLALAAAVVLLLGLGV